MKTAREILEIRKDKDIIWHYTSIDVFKKMMMEETGLYATHVRFLNDSSEFRYGFDVVRTLSEEYIKERSKESNNKDILKRIKFLQIQKKQKQLEDMIDALKRIDVYVTCFSRDYDNLYQWWCYTPEGGVSIGFSRQELQKTIFGANHKKIGNINSEPFWMFSYSSPPPECDALGCLCKCLYSKKEQKDAFWGSLSSLPDPRRSNMFFLAALMKHNSFSFENEERIVYSGSSCFSKIEIIGNKPRIPIIGASKSNIRRLIKGVIISPHGNREQNFYLAHLLAHKCNLDWEPIPSSSPYIGG